MHNEMKSARVHCIDDVVTSARLSTCEEDVRVQQAMEVSVHRLHSRHYGLCQTCATQRGEHHAESREAKHQTYINISHTLLSIISNC